MQSTVKVAVSLPKAEFRLVEQQRRRLKVSRSAVVREALSRWLESFQQQQAIQQYVDGYRRIPEDTRVGAGIEELQADALARDQQHEAW